MLIAKFKGLKGPLKGPLRRLKERRRTPIKKEVEAIIAHSQDYPFNINATSLLSQWKTAKAPFLKLFGGKTYIRSEKPIKITLSPKQRSHKFNEFLSTLKKENILTEDLETFLRINTEEGFFQNKVILPYPSYHIPQGAKLLKSFKKFLSDPRQAQDTASRYIQENKIEGYLYLSVDPRDFLTISENDLNWRSCQSLDGDYRSGNLSYMVDNTTIIAYLADAEPKHFNCLPQDMRWFDKKWRMLIHTNLKTCIYYNKQYPYNAPDLRTAAHETLTGLLPTFFTEPKHYGFKAIVSTFGKKLLTFNQLNAGGRTYDTRDIINADDYSGYCDLISSNSYSPIVAVNVDMMQSYLDGPETKEEEDKCFKNLFGIKIGEKAICPVCGNGYVTSNSKLLCDMCIANNDADIDFFLVCDSCNRRIYDNEPIYFDEDNIPYCETCYNLNKEIFGDGAKKR